MDVITDAIYRCLNDKNYPGALFLAFTIPSICGAIESPDGQDTRDRYIAWFDRYVSGLSLRGQDCYRFRCSLVHQGRVSHPGASFNRVIFTFPTPSGNMLHDNMLDDALNLDIPTFCRQMIDGVGVWQSSVEDQPNYQNNLQSLVRLYPNGLAPYITGTPVIS